jgi:hypothetical protein
MRKNTKTLNHIGQSPGRDLNPARHGYEDAVSFLESDVLFKKVRTDEAMSPISSPFFKN